MIPKRLSPPLHPKSFQWQILWVNDAISKPYEHGFQCPTILLSRVSSRKKIVSFGVQLKERHFADGDLYQLEQHCKSIVN